MINLDAIRARLKAATPNSMIEWREGGNVYMLAVNAAMIASAPADLAALLAIVEAADALAEAAETMAGTDLDALSYPDDSRAFDDALTAYRAARGEP